MMSGRFFNETTEQSQAKAAIVSKYFWAWAQVIMPSARQYGRNIAYIDLFAGPGRYKDGAESTPPLVLEKAIQDRNMREILVTIFNDVDANNSRSLEQTINAMPGVDTLKHAPKVSNEEVGQEIVKMFEDVHLVPTLFAFGSRQCLLTRENWPLLRRSRRRSRRWEESTCCLFVSGTRGERARVTIWCS